MLVSDPSSDNLNESFLVALVQSCVVFFNAVQGRGCHRSGNCQRKIIVQGHGKVGEFYAESEKIDISKESQGRLKQFNIGA